MKLKHILCGLKKHSQNSDLSSKTLEVRITSDIKYTVIYDDTIFRLQRNGGISFVFQSLIRGFANSRRIHVKRIVSGSSENIYNNFENTENVTSLASIPRWLIQFWPFVFRCKKLSIYHTTYMNYVIFSKNVISVCTIHDFGYERGIMQSGVKRFINIFAKKLLIRKAEGIICVSWSTYRDLIEFYGDLIKNKSVQVIHNGIDSVFFEPECCHPIVTGKYILFVGSRKKYKNFNLVLDALDLIPDLKLVIAGGGIFSDYERKNVKRLQDRITIISNPKVEELRNIYRFAFALLYPSKYEGFGLPVVEAFACCCPVIAGNNSSIAEIATNECAVLIDNYTVYTIVDAIKQLENDSFRSSLTKNGYLVAQKFKMDIFINKVEEYYKKIIDSKQ